MPIFLHAGLGKSIRSRDIVGIFDMDSSTVSGVTRDYLARAQNENKVINICEDIPKSFIICNKKNERKHVTFISQLSSGTLCDRLKRKI